MEASPEVQPPDRRRELVGPGIWCIKLRQSSRISGNLMRSCDTAACTPSLLWWLSASNRLISAANSCFTRNSPQSKSLKTLFATLRSNVSVNEDNEICFIQPVNKRVIAPGLRAQYSVVPKACWRCTCNLRVPSSKINPDSITAFIMKSKTFHDEHKIQWEPSEKGLRRCVTLRQVGFNWRMES